MLVFLAPPLEARRNCWRGYPGTFRVVVEFAKQTPSNSRSELPCSLKIQRYVAALLFSDSFLNNNAGIRWPLARPTGDQSRCVLECSRSEREMTVPSGIRTSASGRELFWRNVVAMTGSADEPGSAQAEHGENADWVIWSSI